MICPDTELATLNSTLVDIKALLERVTETQGLDDEIARLRNLLSSKRRELEDWQGYVDRRLGGLRAGALRL